MRRPHSFQQRRGHTHTAGLRMHVVRFTRHYDVQGIKVIQELDDYANHRIKVGDRESSWVSYEGVAKIRYKEGWIAGTTEHYSGVLPRAFLIIV